MLLSESLMNPRFLVPSEWLGCRSSALTETLQAQALLSGKGLHQSQLVSVLISECGWETVLCDLGVMCFQAGHRLTVSVYFVTGPAPLGTTLHTVISTVVNIRQLYHNRENIQMSLSWSCKRTLSVKQHHHHHHLHYTVTHC